MTILHPKLQAWLEKKKWKPFAFQEECWQSFKDAKSGVLHAPTGFGKTLAVFLGPLSETLKKHGDSPSEKDAKLIGCQVIWITPLRALANDTVNALREPLKDLHLNLTVDARTGDTSSYRKAKLREQLPYCLVTTPESLSLLLTYPDTKDKLAHVQCVIVDEWHELIGNKRGVQTEIVLARLRQWQQNIRFWALSATLGNITKAILPLRNICPPDTFITINANLKKNIVIDTLIPKKMESFPWSGHIGIKLAPQVLKILDKKHTTLLFTNTRAQSEIWYQEILKLKPEWNDLIAIHHGSLSKQDRSEVEQKLKLGQLRCVICTSSLDLGIDFSSVDQVIQIGSPKGIARLIQRAGRANHSPGKTSHITCVPTNALELIEFAAAREAWEKQDIESKELLEKPLDILVQHLVTIIIGEPASPAKLKKEIKTTYTYRNITTNEWKWAIEFITNGGALSAYPRYEKASLQKGKLTVTDKRIIQLHRMNIGTITSDSAVLIKFANGHTLGTIEENFISKLKAGKQFIFSGRRLELVRFHKLTATVKNVTKKTRGDVPTWNGGKMPLSSELATAVAQKIQKPDASREMQAVAPILNIQSKWSALPSEQALLIEHSRSREGEHLFFYPFAGRLVHEGLAALVAFRLTRDMEDSIHVTQNDYGFSLTAHRGLHLDEDILRACFSSDSLREDLHACLNTAELARRQFREVARVAGLIIPQLPGKHRNNRDILISAKLLFEVFQRYDPENLLIKQASDEILTMQLEINRLQKVLKNIANKPFKLVETDKLTPMAFPLWADRLSAYLPAGDASTRLENMLARLQKESE